MRATCRTVRRHLVARTADQAWSADIPIADDLFLRLCEAASAQEPVHLRISGNVSTSMRRYAKCLMAGKRRIHAFELRQQQA